MKTTSHKLKHSIVKFTLVALLLVSMAAPAAHYTATWTNGTGTENYSDPNNWDIGLVPLNQVDTFDVIIPAGFTVYFDIDNPGFVTDLDLDAASSLIIDPGHSLTLLDDVTLGGTVQADGAATDLISSSAGTTLGNGAKLYAANGGSIECAAASYSSTSLSSNITLFSADGYNSRLDLSAMQNLDARFTVGYRTQTISATNQGVIDLSELGTLYGASSWSSSLTFSIGSGGYINLYYLTDILGGYTKFDIDIPYYSLPSLETALQTTFDISSDTLMSLPAMYTANSCTFNIPDGGIINAPVLTNMAGSVITLNPSRVFINGGLSNIDNCRITLTEGEVFGTTTGDILATSYSSTSLNDNYTIFSVTGIDTLLDLSSIETLNAGFTAGYRTHTVSATDNAVIDLSSLTTLSGSVSWSSRIKFFIDTDGDIDLSALHDIASGYSTFDINISNYSLPVLQSGTGITFDAADGTILNLPQLTSLTNSQLVLANNATFNAPNLNTFTASTVELNPSRSFINGGLSSIDNTRITLTDGAQFGTATGDITAMSYSSTALNDNYTVFSATGIDTILDLSSFETFNAAFTAGYRTQTISATDNAFIDLSSVGTLYGATSWSSRIKFVMDTAGNIDLDALHDIPSGYSYFDVDIPLYSLPLLETGSGVLFDASGISTIELPALITLTGSQLTIADGGTIDAPLLTSFTSGILDLNPARTFINGTLTDIDNTRITLSGGIEFGVATGDVDVTSFTSTGLNDNYTVFSIDGAGTILDLSTVQSINAAFTAGYRTQTFSITDQATLDLSGLNSFAGSVSWSSRSRLAASGGSQILFSDNLTFSGYAELNLDGSATTASTTGNLTINQTSNFFATDGATLSLAGNFSYGQTDEAQFNADAGIIRFDATDPVTLEVGGANLGVGGATSGNFGIGRLAIGSTLPTTLSLVDLIDNQSDGPNNEALYLYGSGGMEGLRIGPGSTLIIGNVDVYASVGGVMTHINSLFTGGVKWIPFDEGKITLTEYDCSLAADLTGDCFVGLADFAVMAAEWLQCGDLECP